MFRAPSGVIFRGLLPLLRPTALRARSDYASRRGGALATGRLLSIVAALHGRMVRDLHATAHLEVR